VDYRWILSCGLQVDTPPPFLTTLSLFTLGKSDTQNYRIKINIGFLYEMNVPIYFGFYLMDYEE
jgi:hypothetical protein